MLLDLQNWTLSLKDNFIWISFSRFKKGKKQLCLYQSELPNYWRGEEAGRGERGRGEVGRGKGGRGEEKEGEEKEATWITGHGNRKQEDWNTRRASVTKERWSSRTLTGHPVPESGTETALVPPASRSPTKTGIGSCADQYHSYFFLSFDLM